MPRGRGGVSPPQSNSSSTTLHWRPCAGSSCVRPGKSADDFARVGVEQQAFGESKRRGRDHARDGRRALHPVGVAQSGSGPGEVAVPDLVAALAQRQHAHPLAVEDAQLDAFGMRREQREVDPLAVPVAPSGQGRPADERQPGLVDHATHSKYSAGEGRQGQIQRPVATVCRHLLGAPVRQARCRRCCRRSTASRC
jgi:hypothetical protein